MTEWRGLHKPDLQWAPSGLPGAFKALPGWTARVISEARMPAEAASLAFDSLWNDASIPRGRGQDVMLIPGFSFGDYSTAPMHAVLRRFGYRSRKSGIHVNVDCSDRTVDAMAVVAERIVDEAGERIAVVGHSRGGMLARGIAVRRPDLIKQAICLGAPLNDEFAFYEIPQPLVGALRAAHHRDPVLRERKCVTPECTCPYMLAVHGPLPPDVEIVSVYTKVDGVVDWRSCVLPGANNIEVPGSHMGMGMRPDTLRVVLQALAGQV